MEDNALQAWIRYWQLAWKKAPNAKRFSFYRVLPPVLSATAQFVWFRANRPMTQLWISIGLICAVYIFLFAIESIWNCVAVSPVKIHAEQVL
jgi:undecaprenyl pyrophosphate phosphatase UppP